MKNQIFTETEMASVIKQYESGRDIVDLCHEYGISKTTLYIWQMKYSGMEANSNLEVKILQEENRRLKQMYAELMLDHQLAKHIIDKKL